ncbi:hypothetical protein Hanom_Chr10g00953151 [Helianthus anomalus]
MRYIKKLYKNLAPRVRKAHRFCALRIAHRASILDPFAFVRLSLFKTKVLKKPALTLQKLRTAYNFRKFAIYNGICINCEMFSKAALVLINRLKTALHQ